MARPSPDRSRTRISGVFRRHASYHSDPKILVTKSARKIEFELSNPISRIVRQNFRFWGIQSGVATSILGAKQKQQAGNGRPVGGELVNFGVNRRYGAVLCRLDGVIILNSCAICSP
jgi:hypothetical protein